ncbi:uncharacterized protein LOC115311959 [Ixodes scapularis]|uniref:uncharacterized protein LOC115311959 n=1 Tax=Ixodes scapularis TaxID=6945 RepID=UPI001A9ED5C5|nr:uncharacterized protein LOC115311959 [Ixodes scapularis]
MHSAALDPSQATSSSGLFAGHCGPGQHSGPNHPAPVFRKLTKRPEDVIKRLQARISSYRKAIARLRKQQLKTPQTASQALEIIRPHVSEEVFHLISSHVKNRSKGKGKRFLLWLKKFALHLNLHGPRAYRFVSSVFTLPSRRSLRRWLANVKMTPGIIPGIMSSIVKNKVME